MGFTSVSRSYYYLRRRSPGPPFPPDHRQAGERGAINELPMNNTRTNSGLTRQAGRVDWHAVSTAKRRRHGRCALLGGT